MSARTDFAVLRTQEIHESLSADFERHIPWLFVTFVLGVTVVCIYGGTPA